MSDWQISGSSLTADPECDFTSASKNGLPPAEFRRHAASRQDGPRSWPAALLDRRTHVLRRAVLGIAAAALAMLVAGLPARPARADGVLRIGVQKYGTLVILRERKTLEPLLQQLGWSVRWTEFPGGPQLLEALNVGELDFGTTGEAPPVFAQAAGAPLVYVGVEPPSPQGEAILVPRDSPVKTLADLRGRRVALNKGSNVHFLLVQALQSAGMTPADIESVFLAPADARAAFEQGAVDAWAIWDPFFAAGQAATQARVLTDAVGLAPNRQYFLATKAFADAQPALLKALLAQIAETDRWAEQHQDAVAQILLPSLKLPLPVIATALARMGYGVGPMTPAAIADQQRIADTFHDLRLIPVPVAIRDALWSPPS
jgi:sulfonate transport system substrate-binding protein